jgi:transmembrane sensor
MTIEEQDNWPDALDREAHSWVTHLISGEANVTDADAIRRWRNQSPAHEAAFVAAIRQWQDFGFVGQKLRTRQDLPVWTPPVVNRRAIVGGVGALAAAAAGYATVRPPFGLWPSLSELAADYRTTTGEQRHIVLGDNVAVQMNSQTSIAIRPAAGDRDRVNLITGEASFTTTSQREFEVLAGDGRALAVRARFDVRNIGSTVCVTCYDGDLHVEFGAHATTIRSRQQIHYDANGLQPAITIDPAEAGAWHDGVLVFHFTPLSSVIAEINRYRPGRVILMNAPLAQSPVNGRFSIGRMDEVLVWIEYAFGAKPHVLPGGILLLS